MPLDMEMFQKVDWITCTDSSIDWKTLNFEYLVSIRFYHLCIYCIIFCRNEVLLLNCYICVVFPPATFPIQTKPLAIPDSRGQSVPVTFLHLVSSLFVAIKLLSMFRAIQLEMHEMCECLTSKNNKPIIDFVSAENYSFLWEQRLTNSQQNGHDYCMRQQVYIVTHRRVGRRLKQPEITRNQNEWKIITSLATSRMKFCSLQGEKETWAHHTFFRCKWWNTLCGQR